MSKILTSLHGLLLGLDSTGRLVCPAGFVSGQHGKQVAHPSPLTTSLFDDFLGDVIADQWDSAKGSDGAATDWAVNAQVNGVIRGVTGADAGATMALNGIQLSSELNWKANMGGLCFEARVLPGAITTCAMYVGFTDQKSALEFPATISGASLTTNLTDGCGFLFDTAATVSNTKLVGVANNTDATMQTLTGVAPSASVYRTYRIELTTGGAADFYIDGLQVGTRMTGATTATVALTPVVAYFRRAATATNIEVDYVHVSALRA